MIEKIFCSKGTTILEVLNLFNKSKDFDLPSGIVFVVDEKNVLLGTVTEGDIRRSVVENGSLDTPVERIMNIDPIVFNETLTLTEIIGIIPKELRARNRKSQVVLNKVVLVNSDKVPVRVYDYHEMLDIKNAGHRHVVILGLGYVGLTLALVLADSGFYVTGVDINTSRLALLKEGKSYIHEQGLHELLREQIGKNLHVAENIPKEGDVYVISVGTPILTNDLLSRPDMHFLEEAVVNIGKVLRRGNLVILRSTVPIGTCRNVVIPILESESGLKCGIDFHVSFAPERTAEGKAIKELRTLPQIIGGFNNDSVEATAAIFNDVTPTIVRADTLESAEMAKLINNSFRDYIFAYANQMARVAEKFNINVNNVIKAANEGYVRDPVPYPSPGVGGPCLTKDPYIFADVLRQIDLDGSIFTRGRDINKNMHDHVFLRIKRELQSIGKSIEDCKILICGLAFKGNPETGDIRNSSSIEIAQFFQQETSFVFGHDPVADPLEIASFGIQPVEIPEGFKNVDVVLFLNNHKSFEKIDVFSMVRSMNQLPIIYDGWSLFRDDDITSVRPAKYMGISHIKSSIH
jgi:UDP-N-acetyl-D-mannosaminuronic acid dehydrogenase